MRKRIYAVAIGVLFCLLSILALRRPLSPSHRKPHPVPAGAGAPSGRAPGPEMDSQAERDRSALRMAENGTESDLPALYRRAQSEREPAVREALRAAVRLIEDREGVRNLEMAMESVKTGDGRYEIVLHARSDRHGGKIRLGILPVTDDGVKWLGKPSSGWVTTDPKQDCVFRVSVELAPGEYTFRGSALLKNPGESFAAAEEDELVLAVP